MTGSAGGFTRWLRARLERPEVRGIPHDDPRMTAIHGDIIRTRPFLRRLHLSHYRRISRALHGTPAGPVVELGSGGGFLAEVVPGVTTTDIVPAPGADGIMQAERIEAADGSLAGIVMLNVFHHLPDPAAFLREAVRALAPGGRIVMVEPAHTPLGALLYRRFSPEPYDSRAGWGFEAGGRLSAANVPLAWIVFVRDREKFHREIPGLRVRAVALHTAFLYALSGGIWYRGPAPGWSFPLFSALERVLTPAMPLLAGSMTIVIEKAL